MLLSALLHPLAQHFADTAGNKTMLIVTFGKHSVWVVAETAKGLSTKQPGKKRKLVANRVRNRLHRDQPSALSEVPAILCRVSCRWPAEVWIFAGVQMVN